MMRSRLRTALKLTLGFLLSAVFLFLAFRGTPLTEILAAMQGARPAWLLAMFVQLIASHILRAVRWGYLLAPMSRTTRLRNRFSAVMVGYMMNNVLPRAGELLRPYAIAKLEGIPFSGSLGTIVVERLMDVITFLALIALIPLVYSGALLDAFPWIQQGSVLLAAATLALLGVIVGCMIRRDWTDAVLRTVARVLPAGVAGRVRRFAHSFLDGAVFLTQGRAVAPVLLLTVGVWGLYLTMMYTAFFAFGLEGSLGPDAALVVLAISSIGVAIPTPGGTGTFHFFASESLIRLFGVSPGLALTYASTTHAVGYVGITVWGLYFFLKDHLRLSDAEASESRA